MKYWCLFGFVTVLFCCEQKNSTLSDSDRYQEKLELYTTDSLVTKLDLFGEQEKIDALHVLIKRHWFSSPDQAKIYANKAIEISQKKGDQAMISQSLRLLAGVHYYKGDFESSYRLNVKALEIATKIGDLYLVNNGLNNIGLLYLDMGSYESALEYLLRSLEIKQSNNEIYGLATTLNNIGLVYDAVKEYDEARNYFKMGHKIALDYEDRNHELYSLNNLGNSYLNESNIELASNYFKGALLLAENIDNVNWEAAANQGMGRIHLANDKFDSAFHFFNKALKLSETIEDKKGMAKTMFWVAQYWMKKSAMDSVLFYLDQSDVLASQIKLGSQILDNLELYSKIHRANGNPDQAFFYQNRYAILRDSLLQNALIRNIDLIPLKLTSEKGRIEITEQKNELEARRTINNIYAAALMILLPIVIILFIVRQKLRHANVKISNQKEEYKSSYETVKMLSGIGAEIISTLSIQTIIQRVYESVNKLMPADSFTFGLYNDQNDTIEFIGGMENSQVLPDFSYSIKDSDRLVVKSFKNREVILTNNLTKDYPDYPSPLIGEQPVSALQVPLIQKNKAIGVLSVQSFSKDSYSDYQVSIVENLANYIIIAIENAQTFEKLDASYAQLQVLDEFKESMTAMIVHDFKNSLNTVINFSEGKPTERRMRSIRQAGQLMLNMVMNILDVHKFEETSPKLSLANYHVSKLLKEAVEQLTYLIEQKSIKLEVKQSKAYEVRIDHDLLVRVIVNIMSNAIKYSPQNGIINIEICLQDFFVQVSVKDQGIGIPGNMLQHIFDKYAQVEARKEGEARSTGLGLTFCKMVVEAHGGKIWAESQESMGSTFYFTIPLLSEGNEPVETIEWQSDLSVRLDHTEKKIIEKELERLSELEVYDYSDVKEILDNISADKINLEDWKGAMMKAIQNGNEELYKNLISLL